jgi:hypothetical protein
MTKAERADWLRRVLFHGAVLVGLVFAAYLFLVAASAKNSMAFDVVSYWRLDLLDPYHGTVGDLGFFPYSPAWALLFAPFASLPWIVFATGWYALLMAALVFMGGRSTLVLLAFPPVAIELYHGNIHLILAAAIVIGMRYPVAWSVVLLGKLTPGIGLLWFVARREWRSLGIALGATAVIAAVTFVFLPNQWLTWLNILVEGAGVPPPWPALPIPIWLRLPVAAGIVWFGAKRDLRWTVPIAAALAVPALWPGAFAILAACLPLSRRSPAGATGPAGASAAATAAEATRDYHAPDARQPRGEPEPAPT